MNREDVAMDVTFENLEILRKEVQAAKLLLSECDKVLEEDGGVYIELRAFLSSKMSADEVIKLLASQQGDLVPGHGEHLLPSWRSGQVQGRPHILDFCPPKHPEQAEGAQGEREAIPDNGPWHAIKWDGGQRVDLSSDDFTHDVALTVSGDFATADDKFRYAEKMAAWMNAALVQPSPAPELERPEVVGYCDPSHIQRMKDDKISGFMVHDEKGTHISEPLMIVAQHAGIIAKWADLLNRANDRADAAQARVAELEQYKAILRTLVEESTCADWSGENDESVFHAAQQWCGKYHEAKRQLDAAQARSAALESLLKSTEALADMWREKVAQAGQVPEGFVLVPLEPTKTMLVAAAHAFDGPDMLPASHYSTEEASKIEYRAMLAAAPAQGGE